MTKPVTPKKVSPSAKGHGGPEAQLPARMRRMTQYHKNDLWAALMDEAAVVLEAYIKKYGPLG